MFALSGYLLFFSERFCCLEDMLSSTIQYISSIRLIFWERIVNFLSEDTLAGLNALFSHISISIVLCPSNIDKHRV